MGKKIYNFMAGVVIAVFLFLAVYSVTEAQFKTRTLNYILPGSNKYLADRFFMTYCPNDSNTSGNSLSGILGPFPYKCRIHGFYARVGDITDTTAISLYAGTGSAFISATYLVGDTTRMDSTYTSIAVGTSGGILATMDTLSPGHMLFVRAINGTDDSITVGDETDVLNFPSITGLFEILE